MQDYLYCPENTLPSLIYTFILYHHERVIKLISSTDNEGQSVGFLSPWERGFSCFLFPVSSGFSRLLSHHCSCFTVYCSGIFRGKIAPGTSSLRRTLTLLQSALASAMFVLTRVPPNNPISAYGATSSPGYHFFKVSYYTRTRSFYSSQIHHTMITLSSENLAF